MDIISVVSPSPAAFPLGDPAFRQKLIARRGRHPVFSDLYIAEWDVSSPPRGEDH